MRDIEGAAATVRFLFHYECLECQCIASLRAVNPDYSLCHGCPHQSNKGLDPAEFPVLPGGNLLLPG